MDDIQKFSITIRSQVVLSILNKYGADFDTSEVISRAEAISNFILHGEKPVDQLRSPLVGPIESSSVGESPFINVPVNGVYYNVYGRQTYLIEKDILATDLCDAVKKFRLENPMATIEYIDDREVVGLDEETLHPIFDGDHYTCDGDGIFTLIKSAPWPAGKED